MVAVAQITGLDVLRAVSEGAVETPPAAALLGWKALLLEPGHVRVRYTARPEFGNPQGAIQGGFLAAMLDDAMGSALFTTLAAVEFAPSIEMKVIFVRPART
jgi:acyl-coenzyme A thioesterase PaaI-like protein